LSPAPSIPEKPAREIDGLPLGPPQMRLAGDMHLQRRPDRGARIVEPDAAL